MYYFYVVTSFVVLLNCVKYTEIEIFIITEQATNGAGINVEK